MIDFFEKTKGSISLFLALIMLPMMTVAGLIVDGARISAAKASLSGAGDLATSGPSPTPTGPVCPPLLTRTRRRV